MSTTPDPVLPAAPPRRFRTSRTISALFIREMSSTYGRNIGGYIWAVAEPVAALILLTLVFSLALRAPSIGTNFPLFYASGLLPFMAFNDISKKLASAIKFSRPLLQYPGVTWMDAFLARLMLNALTQVMVAALVLTGIIQLYNIDVVIDFTRMFQAFALTFWLATGIGALNCVLMSFFPVWERFWTILTRPLLIISGIFFIFDDIPMPYQDWLWYNPLIHIVGMSRDGIYISYDAGYVSEAYVIGIGGVCMLFGFLFLRRYHKEFLIRK